jgi:hypothetical protein
MQNVESFMLSERNQKQKQYMISFKFFFFFGGGGTGVSTQGRHYYHLSPSTSPYDFIYMTFWKRKKT